MQYTVLFRIYEIYTLNLYFIGIALFQFFAHWPIPNSVHIYTFFFCRVFSFNGQSPDHTCLPNFSTPCTGIAHVCVYRKYLLWSTFEYRSSVDDIVFVVVLCLKSIRHNDNILTDLERPGSTVKIASVVAIATIWPRKVPIATVDLYLCRPWNDCEHDRKFGARKREIGPRGLRPSRGEWRTLGGARDSNY